MANLVVVRNIPLSVLNYQEYMRTFQNHLSYLILITDKLALFNLTLHRENENLKNKKLLIKHSLFYFAIKMGIIWRQILNFLVPHFLGCGDGFLLPPPLPGPAPLEH